MSKIHDDALKRVLFTYSLGDKKPQWARRIESIRNKYTRICDIKPRRKSSSED